MVVVFNGDPMLLHHMSLDNVVIVLYLVSTELALVSGWLMLKRVLRLRDLVLLQQMLREVAGV